MFRKRTINKIIAVIFISIILSYSIFCENLKKTIIFFTGSSDSYKISRAIYEVNKIPAVINNYEFYFFTDNDLEKQNIPDNTVIKSAIIIVDIMYRNLAEYVLKKTNFKNTKVYGVRSGSIQTDKFIINTEMNKYYESCTEENIKNLILFIIHHDFNLNINYDKPRNPPKIGIFHPQSDKIFNNYNDYIKWYKEKKIYKENGFWAGIADYQSYINPDAFDEVISCVIQRLEGNNINVLPVYSYPDHQAVEKYFFDIQKKSRINMIIAFSHKFTGSNNEKILDNFKNLDIPVFDAIRINFSTIDEWKASVQGLSPMEITYQISTPEFSGIIEPSVLGGKIKIINETDKKEVYSNKPIIENIDFLIKRIISWRKLQIKPNKNKKVAIIYWNHTPGKQNIGASYLNVFRSLEVILKRMKEEGYSVNGKLPGEEEIKDFVLKSGRNIGSWAPGELDSLIASSKVIEIPVLKYLDWYKRIDENYRKELEKQWGKVEDSNIMIKDKKIIIPCVDLGNIILVPQPSRGWGDDPIKLYHSTQLMPHHQYTAFYLWLKNEFKADSIISLGTHGTHEWLPGKQAGLSQSCPPEVLIQDIPNIYPYIMDNIGEGLQAKRRGRGIIIDHLIPAMKKSGIYEEYLILSALIDEYNNALTRDESLAEEKLKRITGIIKKMGLDKDLSISEINNESVEKIGHYLIDIKEKNIPYGMHTFGVSPEGKEMEEFSRVIKERNEDIDINRIKKDLGTCNLEIESLINGLEGKYISSGKGNDPLRNPDAIPTGKNFYGFDPSRVPSRDAFLIGKKQAEEMIEKYLKEKKGYPDKIGLVLWSTEVQRNEGTQIGTALYLLGMKPVWDKNDKVIGVEPIPGSILGRPRIDVHLQASGLFRDAFPNVILLLDDAVRIASQLNDVDNFIAKHSREIKDHLVKNGYSKDDAENLSKIRVFSEMPGSYGTKIAELIPNSGIWQKDDEIADVFINMVSFGYGKGVWGKPLESVYKKNLEDVKITMHTLSSNLFMTMDNDDVYQYLGGLSLAVKKVSGKNPDVVVSRQENSSNSRIEDIEKTLGEELRARYLNPCWIEGMKKEKYAGAREMDKFVDYMWGWQVTTPDAIDKTKWEQVYEVYVEDKYKLEIKEFFEKNNPWTIQSINARMLEAIRKEYWDAPENIKKKLAVEYALNVMEKGLACCDHTCNNPALNQMVVNIISIPGLLSPEQVNQFKTVVSKAMGMNLEKAVEKRKELQDNLKQVKKEIRQDEKSVKSKKPDKEKIEGYEIIEEKKEKEDTKLTRSGSTWVVMIIIVCFMILFIIGWVQKKRMIL